MDKRLSIALLLTAVVVAVTPILFPTPRRAVPAPTEEAVSGLSQKQAVEKPTVEQVATPPAATKVVDSGASAAEPSATAATLPEITAVEAAKSSYRFSNTGAAPLAVVMKDYRNLSPAKGTVELTIPGRTLLRYSLALPGDTVSLQGIPFQLSEASSPSGERVLTYRAFVNGVGVVISYAVVPDRYVVHVTGRVENAPPGTYLLIELPSGLPITEADTLSDLRTLSYSFKPTRGNARGVPFGKLDPGERRLEAEPLAWAAVRNKYFVIGLVNSEGGVFEEMTLVGGPRTTKVATNASATLVKAVKNGVFAFDMYAGPQQSTQLLSMGRDFDHVNPYGWSFLQPVVNPIAALCIKLLLWMHVHLNLSYGWVLVIFGVLIRIALWPLNQKAMRSGLKMQELQPRLAEVQKKYKDKPERQREEMMRVYKEAGASPFTALSGCLPMLIPMPVLFALFFVFQNTIEFRGVPFLWLADISIKDPLYILPVLMGASMYLLSWMGLRNAPPNPQAKMMSYMFPVMMTFVLANMASGLNLYYTAQNIAALPQQWLLAKERQKARRTG
jgi:YidC/Oxa1 family membrane protein insertase